MAQRGMQVLQYHVAGNEYKVSFSKWEVIFFEEDECHS